MMNRFVISILLLPLISFAQEETFGKALNQNHMILSKILKQSFNQQFFQANLNKFLTQDKFLIKFWNDVYAH